jgi:acetaldehyde dehydrogenase
MTRKTRVAIIGTGNIGTDLMIKVIKLSKALEMGAFVGIDPQSDGLKRAAALGVPTTAGGIDGLVAMPQFADIEIVFDATSAAAHARHDKVLRAHGKRIVDLTPAAIGPYSIPAVSGDASLGEPNVNMVTCGGQATIPIVAAVGRVAKVHYGEIVARSPRSPPVPAPAPTSTNSPRPPRAPSRCWAAPGAARRSLCSIPPSRR